MRTIVLFHYLVSPAFLFEALLDPMFVYSLTH